MSERFNQLRIDEASFSKGYTGIDEILPLDDPVFRERVGALRTHDPAPELSAHGRKRKKQRESRRYRPRRATRIEIEIEVISSPHHAVPEAVGGHRVFQRQEEGL